MRIAGGIILVSAVLFSACAPGRAATPSSGADRCDGQAYLVVSNGSDETLEVVQSGDLRARFSRHVLAVVGPRSEMEVDLSPAEDAARYYLQTTDGRRYVDREPLGTAMSQATIRRSCR